MSTQPNVDDINPAANRRYDIVNVGGRGRAGFSENVRIARDKWEYENRNRFVRTRVVSRFRINIEIFPGEIYARR